MRKVDWMMRLTGYPQPQTAEEANKLVDKLNARARERIHRRTAALREVQRAVKALAAGKQDVNLTALHQNMARAGMMMMTQPALVTPGDMLRFHQQIIRPMQPKQRRGRPPKVPDAPTLQTSRSLDPVLAKRAYQLHLDGRNHRQIAKDLLPKALRDTLSNEAARHRIRRLITLGQRIHRQEEPSKP